MSIALYDDFANSSGAFLNYDTYDSGQRSQLANQRHVDIRTFQQASVTSPYTMFDLDPDLPMSFLDTLAMSALEGEYTIIEGEDWTAGTLGPQTDRHYFNGISLACSSGTTTTLSIDAPVSVAAFVSTDYISLALPAFPLASVTLASTFLDLTSEPSGNFTTGPTASLAFSTSTTTLIAGDSEARFPLSSLAAINPAAITGVRFRVQATGSCTFRCLAIRTMAAAWEYAPVDQNTLYHRIGATVPPTGSISQAFSFPAATSPVTPTDWPILLFSDGEGGPGLVDIQTGVIIQTGSNTAENTFTLYLRELPMLTAEASSLDTVTMETLEALGGQPDYNEGVLDDFAETRFLTASVRWGTSGSVHINDETDAGYSFTGISFATQTSYYVQVQLVDDSLRLRIYPISAIGYVDFTTVVFDTTAVVDSTFVQRRMGRFGWYAQFEEGDTYVSLLRPQRVVYGEYRSAGLASVTPVDGAQLFVSATPDAQLYPGAVATSGAVIGPDVTKSRSGNCIRVQCDGHQPLEGLITDPMRFENFYETEIEFDVLAPASAQLAALLRGEGRLILLYLPAFAANQWTHMKIPLATIASLYLSGPYSLYIVQTETGANTWYIDNPSVHARSVSWQGRGQAADPRKVFDPPWIEFGDAINDPYNAAMLGRGNTLQVRGQALSPIASITGVQIIPKYAQLGNFVWPDEAPTYPAAPVPSFTITASMTDVTEVTCDGSASITNSVLNGDFESDAVGATPADYIEFGLPSTYQVQAGWAETGTHSLRLTMPTEATPFAIAGAQTANMPVGPGQVLSYSAAANTLSSTGTAIALVGLLWNGVGAFVEYATASGTGVHVLTDSDIIVPPGTTAVSLFVGWDAGLNGSANAAADGYFDAVSLSVAPTYYWTFGDGTYAYGEIVTHQYEIAGTYTVNLTVIDTLDQETSLTQIVTV